MEKEQSADRIFGLDFMRAVAILMVLYGHCLVIYPESQTVLFQFGLIFGFLGVEVFFVLSGFLIGRILYRMYTEKVFSLKSVLGFLKRRWFRTLPNYYLVLIFNIIISLVIGYAVVDGWKYFLFLQNFNSPLLPFFPESWSLSVEEFAYLLLPLVLFAITTVINPKPANKSKCFFGIILGLIMFFVSAKVYYAVTTESTTLHEWNLGLKAVVVYRLDAVFMGVLAAWVSLNFKGFWKKIRFPFAFSGLILFVGLFVGVGFFQISIEAFPYFWNVFYLPLTSFMCVLFLPLLSQWKSLKYNILKKGITFVSKISYSIYLLHYSVILQLLHYYFPTDKFSSGQLHAYAAFYLVITFFSASLLYKWYEKPMMDLRDR